MADMFSRIKGKIQLYQNEIVPTKKRHKWLRQWISGNSGFYVEAGANDGIGQDPTWLFERDGWRGLLVEPIPEKAEICRRNRPHSIVEQCALVPDDFTGDSVELMYVDKMTLVRGAMGSPEADEAHVRNGLAHTDRTYVFNAPAMTLNALLERHNVKKIDLLVLDVEGFEAQAIRGLDLKRWTPSYMFVEARHRQDVDGLLLDDYRVVGEYDNYDVLYELRGLK